MSYYQKYVSVLLSLVFGKGCRRLPTCSEYSHEAFTKYGKTKGLILSAKRILSCNPFGKTGYDPLV